MAPLESIDRMALEWILAHPDGIQSMAAKLTFDLMPWQNSASQENDQLDYQIGLQIKESIEMKFQLLECMNLPMHGQ